MTRSARQTGSARPLSLATLLDQEVSALDEVLAEVRGGVRDAAHFDALEQRVTDIAMGLRAAFRTTDRRRPNGAALTFKSTIAGTGPAA